MANARRRLWICNSYFIPDPRLRKAVIERAREGVDVRILVPGNHTDAVPVQLAGRSYYQELLEAGVRVFEFQPAMMHAKTIVADENWSVIGSANMDERSMELNEENIVGVADESLARAIAEGWRRISPDRRRCPSTVAPAPGVAARAGGGGEGVDRAVLGGREASEDAREADGEGERARGWRAKGGARRKSVIPSEARDRPEPGSIPGREDPSLRSG